MENMRRNDYGCEHTCNVIIQINNHFKTIRHPTLPNPTHRMVVSTAVHRVMRYFELDWRSKRCICVFCPRMVVIIQPMFKYYNNVTPVKHTTRIFTAPGRLFRDALQEPGAAVFAGALHGWLTSLQSIF